MGQEVSEIAAEILPWKDCYLTGQEGAARQTKKEFTQFLYMAAGSASEIDTQVELAL